MNFAMDNKQYADAYLMESCMNKQLGKKKTRGRKMSLSCISCQNTLCMLRSGAQHVGARFSLS